MRFPRSLPRGPVFTALSLAILATFAVGQAPPSDPASEVAQGHATLRTWSPSSADGASPHLEGDSATEAEHALAIHLPGGDVLRVTGAQVRGPLTIHEAETGVQLYLWEEYDAEGSSTIWYARSRDGRKSIGRPRPAPREVRLASGRFDPLYHQPQLPLELQAPGQTRMYLIQLLAPPLEEHLQFLAQSGVRVHRTLSESTLLVSLHGADPRQVGQWSFVRWTGPLHLGWRVETALWPLLIGEGSHAEFAPARYSIMLAERGLEAQERLLSFVESMGGMRHVVTEGGFRCEASLDPFQLRAVLESDLVTYVDRWGGPGEHDVNNVRIVGGANYLEGAVGMTGQGVRGEVFDSELLTTHQEWGVAPIIHSVGTTGSPLHGTDCYSINFATGVDADARGIVPDAQGIFFQYNESSQFGGPTSRYVANAELIDPAGPFRAVYQTSSIGSARTQLYTTLSAETDDYLFQHRILSCQSQSNAGNQNSRPQAWSKNIVSVGGVYHFGTATLTDDSWSGGASIGPAADNRIKPDLAFWYDQIRSAVGSGNTNYRNFGGTSAATPETAGHFGLLHQMWHEGVWSGFGGAATVFDSRPRMATAKALMINSAQRYNWLAGGPNADITRDVQGWGLPDLEQMHLDREDSFIVDGTDQLTAGQTATYSITVDPGTTELRATMVYTDPMGAVGAAQARVNDLSLRVTAPNGTVYWGNQGLRTSNWSTAGGSSNTIDTVENVFLQNPAAGTWTVEVLADIITQDAQPGTPAVDAVFGLVVAGGRSETTPGGGGAGCEEVEIAPFSRTFTSSTLTRGYWFTAPRDFVLCGLQVPDESGHGLQNVEVVRFDAGVTPPTYSSTTNAFTSLYRNTGAPSGSALSMCIPIRAGETIGILGACGDASTMRNSYGTGPFTTDILGSSVQLHRMGMQFNLVTTAAQNLWTSSSSIGRVRMFVSEGESLDIAPFARTFTSGSLTRGYWFQAPSDIIIRCLQVPDETNHGLQNVEVVRFDAAPPVYSSTTNAFTSLFRAVGVSSAEPVSTCIPVRAGDYIGILGACGDTSTMRNSYGNGPFTSSILGTSVTLGRLGIQSNLAAAPAANIWSQTTGSIGRVEVVYEAASTLGIPGFVRTYSSGTTTRGLWFTAPIDFQICGLQVPDESGHGLQNVEVVRFNAGVTPPSWSSTTNAFTSLFRSVGVPASGTIATSIDIQAGDTIGILGACGDSTTMRNSYGSSGVFVGDLLGIPVDVQRMGMQSNLVSTAASNLWTENGPIGRIQVFVSGAGL